VSRVLFPTLSYQLRPSPVECSQTNPIMIECYGCSKRFRDQWEANEHMEEYDHWDPDYNCPRCNRLFASVSAMEQHQRDVGHWEHECETCQASFQYKSDWENHMHAFLHFKHYCKPCKRSFNNDNNLKMVCYYE
jgi:Zinc-finger of C2H2 type